MYVSFPFTDKKKTLDWKILFAVTLIHDIEYDYFMTHGNSELFKNLKKSQILPSYFHFGQVIKLHKN